ncbi:MULTISPECIES: hypothetical protein [unclassified Lentimicrobium]|uniref:hypothetical protein n=1 Tax=unclassified Lentimicrobium TaxID=2677434 RepID=UPI0015560878|nr:MULTISPECIES: hypothetical protein [unclassified Lentimicrobium]NPD48201.1 hypothetical protein [Lentimicrobium sp. S6]NPD86836.1 hypothetical protein [Lentimicrobium sp. L6]
MKKIIFLLIVLSTSCTIQKSNETVKFDPTGHKENQFYIDIPIGGRFEFIGGGSDWTAYGINYKDSSFIYLTNQESVPYYSLENFDSHLESKFLQATWADDTIIQSGVNENDRYWKNIRYHGISLGYKNVELEQKQIYDQSLNTLRRKKRNKLVSD